jgi:hypothetical protein
MGYIHDTGMCIFQPPELSQIDDEVSAWSDEGAGNVWSKDRAAAAGTFVLKIPFILPHQNSTDSKGSRPTSIDIWWYVGTAALVSLAAAISLVTLPATGSAWGTATAQTFTYDTSHDTAGERITAAYHKMTLTLDDPDWIANTRCLLVELSVEAAGTSVFKYFGSRINYTLRV